MNHAIDISAKSDECANALLCAFDTPVKTAAGAIHWDESGQHFVLSTPAGKPRTFTTASGAIEVLRRISRKAVSTNP